MENRPTVLVVEDDVEMNELERELLDIHGMEAMAAYSGTEALEVMSERSADGVLLDLMLPEMDGYEACTRLRERENGSGHRTVIVIISALDNEESRRKGFQAGADAYFVKPFDVDEVINTLRVLIDRRSAESV
ncbi:MAG: response regulator transcription factor [Phycisphaerae bacterium]